MRRLALAAALLAAQPAAADEVTVDFGLSFTTNYLFRGVTQTDDKPAAQFSAEVGWRGAFANTFISNVDFGNRAAEWDFAAGYRWTSGALSYELRVARFFYTDTGDCCGEAVASVDWAVREDLLLGAEFHYDRGNADRYLGGTASHALGEGFYVSGAAGVYLDEDADADFNLGVGRDFGDGVAVDVRAHHTTLGPWRVNASLSFATDWASLRGR